MTEKKCLDLFRTFQWGLTNGNQWLEVNGRTGVKARGYKFVIPLNPGGGGA